MEVGANLPLTVVSVLVAETPLNLVEFSASTVSVMAVLIVDELPSVEVIVEMNSSTDEKPAELADAPTL